MHDSVYPVLILFGFHGSMTDAYPSAVYPPPPEGQVSDLPAPQEGMTDTRWLN
jgi:hypothetical protein